MSFENNTFTISAPPPPPLKSHRFVYIVYKQVSQTAVDKYRKTSNISHSLVGNKIVDHSDVVGASPVGAAPTTSSFST